VRRLLLIVAGALLVWSGTAGAAQIIEPASQPFVVPSDKNGNPVAFTITATGFASHQAVFVEQCDGKPPTSPQWQPSANCDGGSSPAPVFADPSGRATFDKNDPNHRFVPFVGDSPQGLFSCPAPGTCTIRVSSNNASATADQVFLAIRLPTPHGPPAAHTNSSSGGASASPSSTNAGTAADAAGTGTSTSAAASTGANASAPATGSKGPSDLAFTGMSTLLAGIGLLLLGLGIAVLSRHAGRRAPT
jgi:hypothetical protein